MNKIVVSSSNKANLTCLTCFGVVCSSALIPTSVRKTLLTLLLTTRNSRLTWF